MGKNILAKYRGAILARGLVAIAIGILVMCFTQVTLEFLVVLMSVFALIDGLILIIGSFFAKEHNKWWVFLLEGIFSFAFGIVLITYPAITVVILLYLIAIWAIITGLIELVIGFAEDEGVLGKWLLATTGVLSVIIGILMLVAPIKTLEVVIWLVGLYAFIVGIAMTIFSMQIRNK